MNPIAKDFSMHPPNPQPIRAISPLLVLCPLLAVSDSVINGLGLGLVAVMVVVVATAPLSITLQTDSEFVRIATAVAIVSATVTVAILLTDAYFHELYLAIGAYLPVLAAGGILVARGDLAAPRERRRDIIVAGLRTGFVFAAVLVVLSAGRELVGNGSLFAGIQTLPVVGPKLSEGRFFRPEFGFVLAILPPGAFIAVGLLLAARNWYREKTS
jgi:Na+-translocating ferredoxin:NAD+ oxidoreductase subunit E